MFELFLFSLYLCFLLCYLCFVSWSMCLCYVWFCCFCVCICVVCVLFLEFVCVCYFEERDAEKKRERVAYIERGDSPKFCIVSSKLNRGGYAEGVDLLM